MSDHPSVTSYSSSPQNEISILEDPYRREVLTDNFHHSRKKTKYALFSIALVFLIAGIFMYLWAGLPIADNLPYILMMPALFVGLGLFAHLQPLIAAITAIVVIVGLTIVNYVQLGAMSLVGGWIYKVIIFYFLLRSVQHARDAEKARKELAILE
ncbi:MAG TPA: hypothetical protein VF609_01545 [Flavisolibacter sp.]|jgi:hypothetical protein